MSIDRLYHDIDQARAFCELIMDEKHTYELLIQRLGKRRNAFVRTPAEVVSILEAIKPESYNVIWIRANPLNRDLAPLAAAMPAEDKQPNSSATGDDVARWCFVQVDFDAVKADGNKYASSDTEHLDALKARDRYHSHALTMYDIEPAYIGDSGNGGVLLYRVDLPNTPQNTKLIKDAFRAIAESAGVKIDTATLDVVRFMGLPGTINRGKEAAEDRPHRLRTGEVYPDAPIVSAAILETLQAEYRPLQSPESHSQEQTDESELTDSERDELISIISEGWKDGNRHNYGLAVSGLLFHMGVKLEQAKSIIETLSTKAGDTDTDDRLEACERTYERGAAGEPVAWFETLNETLPQSSMQAIGKLRAAIRDRTGGDDDAEWQEPIPLDDPTGPAFDTDTLPGTLGSIVSATSEAMQTPTDVPAIMALATISASAGGRYIVAMPEWDWKEPVHIHTLVTQPPGSRKSPTERAMTWPVTEYESEVNPGERLSLANWESLGRVKDRALKDAEGRAGRATDDGKISNPEALRMAALEDLSSHQESKPRVTRIRIDDATAEAAVSLAAENGGAIGVLSAESAILDRLALNPYGDSPNLEPLLKGHAGDSHKVDRKNRPAEIIDRFCMTVGVMVQPSLIPKLGAVQGFVDRGAAARFLPSFPVDLVGTRRIDTAPVPEHLKLEYGETIKRILRRVPPIKNGCYVPWVITLDDAAFSRMREFRMWHESELGPRGAFGDLRDWSAKLPGQILRIAALLHIYQHNEPEAVSISLDTLNRAISIGEYFAAHAEIMYRMMSHETGHETARTVWSALIEHGEMSVNRSQLQQRLRGRRAFKRAADLDGPLAVLEEYGYIRIRKESSEGRGRPAEWIDLNPLAMHQERPSAPVVRFTSNETEDLAPTGTEGFRFAGEAI